MNEAPIFHGAMSEMVQMNCMATAKKALLIYKTSFNHLVSAGLMLGEEFSALCEKMGGIASYSNDDPQEFTQLTSDDMFLTWADLCIPPPTASRTRSKKPEIFTEEQRHKLCQAVVRILVVGREWIYMQATYNQMAMKALEYMWSARLFDDIFMLLQCDAVERNSYCKKSLTFYVFCIGRLEIDEKQTFTVEEAEMLIRVTDLMVPFDKGERLFYAITTMTKIDTRSKLAFCNKLKDAIPSTPFLSNTHDRSIDPMMPCDYYIRQADLAISSRARCLNKRKQ